MREKFKSIIDELKNESVSIVQSDYAIFMTLNHYPPGDPAVGYAYNYVGNTGVMEQDIT